MQTTVPVCSVDPDQFAQMRYSDEATRKAKAHGMRMWQNSIDKYVEATIHAARAKNAALIDHFAIWKARAADIDRLTDGGFHPNDRGYRLLARTLLVELGLFEDSSLKIVRSLCNEDVI